jgi:hypothetical protein
VVCKGHCLSQLEIKDWTTCLDRTLLTDQLCIHQNTVLWFVYLSLISKYRPIILGLQEYSATSQITLNFTIFIVYTTINFFPCASGGPCPDFSFEVKPSLPLKDNSPRPPSPTTAAAAAETHPDTRRKLFRPYCLDDPPATDQKPPLAAYIAAAAAPGGWWVPPPGNYSPLDLSSKVLPSSPPSLELKV